MNPSLHPVIAALRSGSMQTSTVATASSQTMPFVTITRAAGAGGGTLARRLADRLNAGKSDRWHSFDRELVEMIAADQEVSQSLLDSLEDTGHNWVTDIIAGIAGVGGRTGEAALYRKVAQMVLALARLGHVIIVGRGGRFITDAIPGGVHVMVVAPMAHRVAHLANLRGVSMDEAGRLVRTIDENRRAFYARHWPDKVYAPESFTLTLNSEMLSEARMVDCILPLIEGAGETR